MGMVRSPKIDQWSSRTCISERTLRLPTSKQIGEMFGFKPRISAQICQEWVKSRFLAIVDPSNRARKYKLSGLYEELLKSSSQPTVIPRWQRSIK